MLLSGLTSSFIFYQHRPTHPEKKKKKIEKMLRLPAMEQPHKRIKTCREETVSVSFFSRAVTGCCHFPCKGVHYGQSVLSHSPQKRQCCVEACCEMTRSSLSLTEAGKTSKHPPNPLRRRRISTCKVTGTALSKVFQDSAKDGLPKKKKKQLMFRGVNHYQCRFQDFWIH